MFLSTVQSFLLNQWCGSCYCCFYFRSSIGLSCMFNFSIILFCFISIITVCSWNFSFYLCFSLSLSLSRVVGRARALFHWNMRVFRILNSHIFNYRKLCVQVRNEFDLKGMKFDVNLTHRWFKSPKLSHTHTHIRTIIIVI